MAKKKKVLRNYTFFSVTDTLDKKASMFDPIKPLWKKERCYTQVDFIDYSGNASQGQTLVCHKNL